jgi:hypothetical protein
MESKVLRPVARLVILGALIACTEKQTVVEPLAVPPVRMTVVPPSVSNAPLMVPEFSPGIIVDLPTYADAVIAEFRLDGTVFARATPGTEKHNHVIDGAGIWIESFTGCYVNVVVTYTQGIWGPGPCSRPLQDPSIDTTLVQGQGTIKRVTGIPQWDYECNYGPCYTYEGAQSYSITPLSAALDLTTPGTAEVAPGQIDVPPGTWVVFKVAPNPLRIKNIDVPLRVVSWQWTASTGGAGQTVLTGGATAIQRSVYIAEPGSMVVTAIVNGAERADTVTVGDPNVVIIPEKDQMKFSILTHYDNGDVKDSVPSSQNIKIWVLREDGSRVLYAAVDLTLTAVEGSGGHVHRGNKPGGRLTQTQVNTGASGEAIVGYTAPLASGPVWIKATSSGSAPDSSKIEVGVFNLTELAPGTESNPAALYKRIGDIPGQHVQNHFATAFHIAKLGQLADAFYKTFKSGPTFNDSSLPLGGVYDLNLNWDEPHERHSEGYATDFKTQGISNNQRKFVYDFWERELKGKVGDETRTSRPHYHLEAK